MRRDWMVLGLVGLTLGLAGCPSDDGEGTGTDGETDSTTSGTMSATSPSTSTTAASTSSSSSTTMDVTTEMTTEMTSMMTETATDTDPTTGGLDCEGCIAENCTDRLGVCMEIKECGCWLKCTAGGGDEPTCEKMCGPMPDEYAMFFECVTMECADECSGGGTSSSSSGGGAGGVYEPCDDMGMCPDDLECNMNLGHCTIDCMGDPENCPAPAEGDAVPECGPVSGTCILNCADGATCPTGLECQPDVGFGEFCGVGA